MFGPGENPLVEGSADVWNSLIDAIGPASLIVLIESRLSAALRRSLTAEDILQDALLHAWRDRHQHVWQGLRSFRTWVVAITENRIRDAADRLGAQKRGGGQAPVPLERGSGTSTDTSDGWAGPVESTTPSRAAAAREEADAMRDALAALPAEVGEVVRLRLFEQLPIDQIAERLQIGPSAVRHRFRRGAELYKAALTTALAGHSTRAAAALRSPKSSPIT